MFTFPCSLSIRASRSIIMSYSVAVEISGVPKWTEEGEFVGVGESAGVVVGDECFGENFTRVIVSLVSLSGEI